MNPGAVSLPIPASEMPINCDSITLKSDVIFVIRAPLYMTKYSTQRNIRRSYRWFLNMEDRLREVVRHIGPSTLAKNTTISDRRRWQTVATDFRTKTRVEDLAALLAIYPEYELYIIHGETDLARGQISPGVTEADVELAGGGAGSR